MFHLFPTTHSVELKQLLSEFNRSLMLIADKQLLISNFLSKVNQIIPVQGIFLFLPDENTEKYKMQGLEDKNVSYFMGRGKLMNWLAVNERPLVVSESSSLLSYFSEEERKLLSRLNAELVYPLNVMNRISGILVMGKKVNGKEFDKKELELLSLLFGQAAFAIEHASLYEIQRDRLKRMYRTDRLAVLGELAAGAAHEIKNPLTSIRSTIQYLSNDFDVESEKGQMMHELLNETERINKIVQGLLSFARPSELNSMEVNLEQLINQTLLLVNNTLKKQRIEVEFEYFTEQTTIMGDAEQLKQVCLNIILNAVEAMKENDESHPRTLYISMEEGTLIDVRSRYLLISFEDTGKGIDEEDIENVFNPFFTTKEEGTGLGLAICFGIINRHKGELEVRSTLGKGTCFTIKLPQHI
ncbi:nitrogen regulation protein NR(II) [Phocaeicola sartorii]|uniref:two-component system sensor histidine kinase NtrB n=2 Tax=Phocaeicola sartorii TaxID=671267 RepID=UPI0013642B39|nr:ATP-binding protein [Phocaeicola sartorii]NBH65576.1 histidine kinase [Phocaeicola sartorii]